MNPFSDQAEKQVQHLGERFLIENISIWLGSCSPPPPAGIGDDAAVLAPLQGDLVVTTDSLVFGKHFDESTPPELTGAKLLKRNISDLAAMGSKPAYAVIACLLPPVTSSEWLETFYRGLRDTADSFSISIVGGDISSTFKDLAFSLTLLGAGASKPLTRKSAKAGDTLWVTGTLGGSILGKHLHFQPRLQEAEWLTHQSGVTSAMDISDGLATDLQNICPLNCNIKLDTDSIPVSADAHKQAETSDKSALEHALIDGEDYELLFTLSPTVHPIEFLTEWRENFSTELTCIGSIATRNVEEESHIHYSGSLKNFKDQGYEHF